MSIDKEVIIKFFRYLWVFLALILILYIISQAFYTKRSLQYNLDFSRAVTKDITGWYPESRLALSAGSYEILAEPLYMKIYSPVNFNDLTISGGIESQLSEDIRIGLRQNDGSWDFQNINITDGIFSNTFYLENAQLKNNQLEIILSIPSLENKDSLLLVNNWKIVLNR